MEEVMAKTDRLPSNIETDNWVEDYMRTHGRYHSCCKPILKVDVKYSNGDIAMKLFTHKE